MILDEQTVLVNAGRPSSGQIIYFTNCIDLAEAFGTGQNPIRSPWRMPPDLGLLIGVTTAFATASGGAATDPVLQFHAVLSDSNVPPNLSLNTVIIGSLCGSGIVLAGQTPNTHVGFQALQLTLGTKLLMRFNTLIDDDAIYSINAIRVNSKIDPRSLRYLSLGLHQPNTQVAGVFDQGSISAKLVNCAGVYSPQLDLYPSATKIVG